MGLRVFKPFLVSAGSASTDSAGFLFQKAGLAFCVRVKDILDLFFSLDIFPPFFKAKSQKTFGVSAPGAGWKPR
jgi:hypothetical protein